MLIIINYAPFTYRYHDYYKILPCINGWSEDEKRIKDGVKVAQDFIYDSGSNPQWMSADELSDWLENNRAKLGEI